MRDATRISKAKFDAIEIATDGRGCVENNGEWAYFGVRRERFWLDVGHKVRLTKEREVGGKFAYYISCVNEPESVDYCLRLLHAVRLNGTKR